ncbi:hypothetical protein P7F60_11165 [Rhizobium sp. YJ-22]|jgi:hypothetical protein|uniref:hypothetical protein n=1 Tax=Rhizobium sp. YJ-22 TaxID=3037556 RepID=UPI002412D6CC|nr:hypothetical protein [Rhizobium sp. YJ-22]MDG3576950.1 hypothetical protein [Rhizobium sp. YJ-22]
MNLRKLSPLMLRICVVIVAVAVLFSAPASQAAAHHTCSTETSVSVGHQHSGDHHSKTKTVLADQACCSTICAVCLLILPTPTELSSVSMLLTRTSDLQDHLTGVAPSPALKPPQSAA